MNKNTQDSPLLTMEREFYLISQDVLLIFDMEGIIIDANNSAVRIFSKNREMLIGSRFVEYFIDPFKAKNAIKQVFDTGDVSDFELVMETKDGPNPIIKFSISPYKDQTGKIVGAFATGHDITQRKREELELHYLQRYNRGLIEVSLDPL
ncbi:MAG: PAS domain-containing protein, partial [Methanosarcinales archaeon]|nr:PAS domain-containing protein [Methanosarcinales archaeon]